MRIDPLSSLILFGQFGCLLIGAIYLRLWWKDRTRPSALFLSLTAFSLIGYSTGEILMMHSMTVEQFVRTTYWNHVFAWTSHVCFALFVWFHFAAGRLWLMLTGVGLRTVAFVISLLSPYSINFIFVSDLKFIDFFGEMLAVPVATRNPLMAIGQVGTLAILLFCIDTAVGVWKRGERRHAVWFGGSVILFVGARLADTVLVMWGLIDFPLTTSPFFMGIIFSLAWELSSDVDRAHKLAAELDEKNAEAHKMLAALRVAKHAGNVGVWVREVATGKIWASMEWRDMFAFGETEEITSEKFLDKVHPEDRVDVLSSRIEKFDWTEVTDQVYRILLPDGDVRWMQSMRRVERIAGEVAFVYGATADITERRRAERAAGELGGLLIGAMETERARLGRELHDDLSQRIALLAIKLQMLDAVNPSDLTESIRELSENIDGISAEVHRISHQLHPATLEQLGLKVALRGFCRELAKTHELVVDLKCDELPKAIPPEVSLCAFRLTQEALRNVVKHSQIKSAVVEASVDRDVLTITVSDKGVGFDQTQMSSRSSLGLISMRERVASLGGSLRIDSKIGGGTTIEATIRFGGASSVATKTA